eukprot:ANDGO_00065.mRNA.1 GCN5-related N-acetyltransferase
MPAARRRSRKAAEQKELRKETCGAKKTLSLLATVFFVESRRKDLMESDIEVVLADSSAHLEYIVDAQFSLARETENLVLDRETVRRGVQYVLEHPDRGSYFIAVLHSKHSSPAPAPAPTPIGCILVMHEWSDWRACEISWLYSLYVSEEHRRVGVFRKLYDEVRRRAMDNGHSGIRLYVERTNEKAQRAYRGVGMKESHYALWEEEFPERNPSKL